MADNKKNIPDTGKMYERPKPGKVEPVKADSPVQDQPAPAKAESPVIEDASKVVAPLTAEQQAPAGKEVPKDKDAPVPSMEGAPQPGKDEKQTTIPGMGDPAPAGKVVDFTAARDGATKGKPPEKAVAHQDKDKQADKAKDAAKPRRGRPPKADKSAPDKAKPQPRDKMSQSACRERCSRQSRDPGRNRAAARPSGCHPWRERGDRVSQSCRAAPVQKSSFWRPGRCGNAGTGGVGQGRWGYCPCPSTRLICCSPIRPTAPPGITGMYRCRSPSCGRR